jgi:hypothetical protein
LLLFDASRLLSPRQDYVPGRWVRACQSTGRFGLKRLVNWASLARMIDKTLAHMIDETLREIGESSAFGREKCLKSL